MKTKIGIDVDGVLRDFVGAVTKKYKEATGHSIPHSELKWRFMYDYSVEGSSLAHKVWGTGEWLDDVFVQAKALKNARKGYNLFVNDPDFDVYVVSAQSKGTEHLTDTWLKDNKMCTHKRTIYTFDKAEVPCKVLIDDKIENLEEYIARGRTAICIRQPWNLEKEFKHTATDMVEAYNILKSL